MNTANPEQAPRPNGEGDPILSKRLSLGYASAGAFIAAVYDSAINASPYSTKFGLGLTKILPLEDVMAVETMGTLFVILCAALIARTQRFKTEHAALISGLMIFATLSVLIPLDRGTTTKIRTDLQPTAPGGSQINSGSSVFHLAMANEAISLQQARRQLLIHVSTHEFQSNAKVKVQRYISSCKPSYYGLFGLGSYLNNSLQTCPTDYALPVGAKIQIISHWETWPSRYNYAQVRYRHLGKTQIGWVQAGWKEEPWAFLELKIPEDSIPEWSSST